MGDTPKVTEEVENDLGAPLPVVLRGTLATYSACINALTVDNSPTDIFLIKGSANKIVKVRRIYFTGFQNNASYQDILVIKRSTDNTGGTRIAPPAVPHDSSDPAASAQVFYYTVNPTDLGTLVGVVQNLSKMISGKNSIVSSYAELLFSNISPSKPLTLNNENECLAINCAGVSMAGSDLSIMIEWTEE